MYSGGMWTSLVDSFHISTNYNTNSYWRQYHDMTFWGLNAMINLNLTIQSPPTFTVRALVRCVPVRVCMTTAGTGPVSRVTCHAAEQTSTSHHTLLPAPPPLYLYRLCLASYYYCVDMWIIKQTFYLSQCQCRTSLCLFISDASCCRGCVPACRAPSWR